jgi:hypothetical protein
MRSPATILALAGVMLSSAAALDGQVVDLRSCVQDWAVRSGQNRLKLRDCQPSKFLACPESCDGSEQQSFAAQRKRPQPEDACLGSPELFALKTQDLSVFKIHSGVLLSAGMTIDADGAPNAYGPKNRGLDYTANARGAGGWVALVTNAKGRPILQRTGPYRGYYVSTTSLQQPNIRDPRDPRRYLDARRIPYIALPPDFARRFGIGLGDLARVVNTKSGRSAYAIFADVGPKGRIGEGSIALAHKLRIASNPRHDSAPDGVTYLIFPGSALRRRGAITAARINSAGARLYRAWAHQIDCELPAP